MKVEYLRLDGNFQRLPIQELKWDSITMDFLEIFPQISIGVDSIRVIVDLLTKLTNFLLI